MSSSDENPRPAPVAGVDGPTPPGKPIKMKQHLCSFAFYSHDLGRQIEAHHYAASINQDVLQCAVYDSDAPSAHLIGVEYIRFR
ncbi:hypothetical protein OPV22_010117 [Ensete ventricosum]|uniref:Uncharacterized protein n=1 Tax=Ensete ventricosum TaxID=4639 RepID=A0AAV8Q1K5_ENSVE|nr:hypothetical protein OPV22_010117 [Ensete ventricosum]